MDVAIHIGGDDVRWCGICALFTGGEGIGEVGVGLWVSTFRVGSKCLKDVT